MTGAAAPWLVDTHCHLDLAQFDEDRDAVIERAAAAGVTRLICPAIRLDTIEGVLALADRHAGIYAAVGVHPNDCTEFGPESLAALRDLTQHPKVVAIGEIGLDYYWKRVEPEQQKQALRAQLALAAEAGLPVILHSRESNDDLLWEIAQWWPQIRKARGPDAIFGVWHAFSGDITQAEKAWELGLAVGLGGPVTFENARRLRGMAPQLRPDRLLLETDAPYLAPHPHRGQRNEPAYVPLIAHSLASLRGVALDDVAFETTKAAKACFWPVTDD
jgi:TatD DNase family protein